MQSSNIFETQSNLKFKNFNRDELNNMLVKQLDNFPALELRSKSQDNSLKQKRSDFKEIFKDTPLIAIDTNMNPLKNLGTNNRGIVNNVTFNDIKTIYFNYCNFVLNHPVNQEDSIPSGRKNMSNFFDYIFTKTIKTEKLFLYDNKDTRRLDRICKLVTPVSTCSAIAVYKNTLYISINPLSGHLNDTQEILNTLVKNIDILFNILKKLSINDITFEDAINTYNKDIHPSLKKKKETIPNIKLHTIFQKLNTFYTKISNINKYETIICTTNDEIAEHAEQKLCKKIAADNATGSIPIGISKPCCFTCADEITFFNSQHEMVKFLITASHTSFIKNVACSLSGKPLNYDNLLPSCDLEGNFSDFTSIQEETKSNTPKKQLLKNQMLTIESIKNGNTWLPTTSSLCKFFISGKHQDLLNNSIRNPRHEILSKSDNKNRNKFPEVSDFNLDNLSSAKENMPPVRIHTLSNILYTLSDQTDKIRHENEKIESTCDEVARTLNFTNM